MTTPTQAQIEAAAKAVRELDDWEDSTAAIEVALAAAAEVGEPNPVLFLTKQLADKQREIERLRAAISYALLRSPWDSEPTKVQTLEKLRNALTAAAEVGGLTESRLKASEDLRTGLVDEIHRQHKEIERLKIQVIERDSAIAGWIKREAATIERCAQVAEDIFRHTASYTKERDVAHKLCPRIAAAIRALKEKP